MEDRRNAAQRSNPLLEVWAAFYSFCFQLNKNAAQVLGQHLGRKYEK
jgi:hypothetical protein